MTAREDALEKLAHLRRRAYRPVVEEGDGQVDDCKLGGTAVLTATHGRPACDACSKPLALVVQLNPRQFPEPLRKEYGEAIMQLWHCLTCDSSIARAITDDERTEADAGDPKLAAKCIRSWTAVDDFPSEHERGKFGVDLDDDQSEAIKDVIVVGEKLSGWPAWLEAADYPSCPVCNKSMRQVFQVDSRQSVDIEFGVGGRGHLCACATHKDQLSFVWR